MPLLQVNELRRRYGDLEALLHVLVLLGYALAGLYAALVLTRRRLLS